jgi:hypothetical protein
MNFSRFSLVRTVNRHQIATRSTLASSLAMEDSADQLSPAVLV